MLLAVLALLPPVGAVEVICNEKCPIARPITQRELQAIFSMRLRSWDGNSLRVFVLKDDTPVHIEFSKMTMDMFPYQLRRYWDRLTFSGTGQAPTELDSPEQMYKSVASTPGGIGYLPAWLIKNHERDGHIRIVRVGGP